jgi:hypothetical protein
MNALSRRGIFVCILVAGMCGRLLADDFQPPGDGAFTDAQLKAYMAAAGEVGKARPALQQQLDAAATPDATNAARAAIDQKITDCAAAQKLSRGEYDWIGVQALDAYQALLGVEQYTDQKTKELDFQTQANNAKFAAAKQRLAAYTAAQKDGRRVMTDSQNAATTQAAAADKDAAVVLLHEDTDSLTSADAALQIHLKDQADADQAYKNPPAGLDALSEASYKMQKADDREKAATSADEDRRTALAAQNNIRLDNSRIAIDDAHIAHPDMPANADEKADIDKLNADTIKAAQKDLDDSTKFAAGLDDMKAKIAADAEALTKDIPPANLDLIRANRDAYAQVLTSLGITPEPATVAPQPATPPDAAPAAPDAGAMQQP